MKINATLCVLFAGAFIGYAIHNHIQLRNTNIQLATALERTSALEEEINNNRREIEEIKIVVNEQKTSIRASIRDELDSIMIDSAKKMKEKALAEFENAYDSDEHVYGNPQARFSLYEYLDFECPYCAQFSATAKKVADDSQGNINVVLRHYPLPMHGQEAKLKALFVECIAHHGGNKSFWYAVHALFSGKNTDSIVQTLNLNSQDIASCMGTEQAITGVLQGLAEGEKLQIDSTPTVFILDNKQNKKLKIPGTPTEGDIANIISGILR